MKEINGQLYGYSYELDATSEEDGTTCFAVDTGTIFFAYSGIWYEQKNAYWQAGGGSSGSSLPEVSADDNGDVLTVVEGEWNKAAPSGGGPLVVNVSVTDNGDDTYTYTCDKTAGEMYAACPSIYLVMGSEEEGFGVGALSSFAEVTGVYYFRISIDELTNVFFEANSADDYPAYLDDGTM